MSFTSFISVFFILLLNIPFTSLWLLIAFGDKLPNRVRLELQDSLRVLRQETSNLQAKYPQLNKDISSLPRPRLSWEA